jgi:hypothetical protein
MRKTVLLAMLGALVLVGPAQARKPPKPRTPAAHPQAKPAPRCVARLAGYSARGTWVSASLTATGRGRYSGMLEVNVTRANHHAATGDQTFLLTNAKVKFHHGVTPPGATGDRVGLHGKITQMPARCGAFTPTITIKNADISLPRRH